MRPNVKIAVGVFAVAIAAALLRLSSGAPRSGEAEPGQTIEQVASTIAQNYNAAPPTNPMTISTRASADGRRVTFFYVLKVIKDPPQAKLSELRAAMYADAVPKICALEGNKITLGFGMSYRLVYDNTFGQRLAEIIVDKGVCEAR